MTRHEAPRAAADAPSAKHPATSTDTVCIVTPAHLASNPRVVKEADALHRDGLKVHVVFAQTGSARHREHDRELTSSREWAWTAVEVPTRNEDPMRWTASVMVQRAYRSAPATLWRYNRIAERSESRAYASLAKAASSISANLYLGHYPEGLAAAAAAAACHSAKLGFDAEDFHTGEANPVDQIARVAFIESRYLPQCTYVSAASAGIGEALKDRYGISEPVVVHNTFPWEERDHLDGRRIDRTDDTLSLYWYSQVIGLDRGIQDAIRALALVKGPVQLHLRGALSAQVKESLERLAASLGVLDRLHFHSPVSPTELLSRAAEHDVGLALEQGVIFNRAICATNKLFFFMLAGLAIAATDVPGQKAILCQHPDAAILYRPGNEVALAAAMERWSNDRELLQRAKLASLEAARSRWNWEDESKVLVEHVRRCLRGAFPVRFEHHANTLKRTGRVHAAN